MLRAPKITCSQHNAVAIPGYELSLNVKQKQIHTKYPKHDVRCRRGLHFAVSAVRSCQ